MSSQLGRAQLGSLQLGAVEPSIAIGTTWVASQTASCSWRASTPTRWTSEQLQSARWVPGYINIWVSLADASCAWTGSLGGYVTSGWLLEARASCAWAVVNTDPGDWESEQAQTCEWVSTIEAVPESCLTGDGLPEAASRGANFVF